MNSQIENQHGKRSDDLICITKDIVFQYDIHDNKMVIFGCFENKHIPIFEFLNDKEKKILIGKTLHFDMGNYYSCSPQQDYYWQYDEKSNSVYFKAWLSLNMRSINLQSFIEIDGNFDNELDNFNFLQIAFEPIKRCTYNNWPKKVEYVTSPVNNMNAEEIKELQNIFRDLVNTFSQLKKPVEENLSQIRTELSELTKLLTSFNDYLHLINSHETVLTN